MTGSFNPAVHVPGLWRCAKCGFRLVQSNLNAAVGTITARDDAGDTCPNDGSPLWRVTWREEAQDAREAEESAWEQGRLAGLREAEARIAELEEQLSTKWHWHALAAARLRVLKMALINDLIRRGHTGKAWNGKFLSEHLELVADSQAQPCMECHGEGYVTDPETGPAMCGHCYGYGVLPPETVALDQALAT